MNILFCTWNYFPAAAGGAEGQARLQAESLARRGHSVTVVCPRFEGLPSGVTHGVRVRRVPVINKRLWRTASYLPLLTLYLLAQGRKFDVIHVHIAALQADVAVLVGRLLRRPIYVKVACGGEGGEVHRMRAVAPLVRYFGLKHATVVQSLSSEIDCELARVGVRPDRIVRLPNGIDTDAFAPQLAQAAASRLRLGLPDRDILVLFAGRFARYKGVTDLLEAWQRIDPRGARLILVGTNQTDALVHVTDSEGIEIRPWTNQIADYFRAVDVVVIPSRADGMSNTLLEAMASGKAVLTSRLASAEELIENDENGLLFTAGDPTSLAEQLGRLIEDDGLRERLGAAARVRAGAFAIDSVVDSLEDVYGRIAA